MTTALDPVVAKKLGQFSRRRTALIVARGLSAGISALLVSMSIVAAVDWYWLLSDQARWLLSGGAYLIVFLAVWLAGMKRLIQIPAWEEIAVQIESTEPELRENLLSAVELATEDPKAIHDSPVFRGLLQGKVAQQMATVQVSRLLPVKLIAGWLVAVVSLVVLVATLLTTGDSRIRQLAVRAILPGANIARVSRIKVEILQPTPHSLTMASAETVAVVVAVSGGAVSEVTLETKTESKGVTRHEMRGSGEVEYAANINVRDESIEYRVLAGDAITQRFRIETRARPHVLSFQKTYAYPEYSQLPKETVTETDGDLIVLDGTRAELTLAIDQPVSKAELLIDNDAGEQVEIVPLTESKMKEGNGNLWTVSVPVIESAIYKVHLVSKETGFENIFAPKYEIRPLPDTIPRVGFVDQQETTLLLPPNDILALKGMAEDDLPVVSLEQQISINGRDWQTVTLDAQPTDKSDGRRISSAWNWDLLTHQLTTGDQVMTKLVATDRKGNLGESIPLRIVVAAPDFDPVRHSVMEQKLSLFDDLDSFSKLLEEQKASALATLERMTNPEQSEADRAVDRSILLDLANRQRERAGEVLARVIEVEREMPPGADAYDLDLTGRVIARIQREYAHAPAFLIKAMEHATADEQKRDLEEIKRTFERSADYALTASRHYQAFMSHNLMAALAADLDALLQQQASVVNSSTQTWERLLRQESVVVNQLRALERLISDQRHRAPDYIEGHLRNLLTWSEQQRQRLQDSMESEDQLPQLRQQAQNCLRELEGRQRMDVADGGLSGRIVGSRKDSVNRSGSLYVPIEQLARSVLQENKLLANATASRDSARNEELTNKAQRFFAEVDLLHRPSIHQLRERRVLTQTRQDADNQYAADAGLTSRATNWLVGQHRQLDPQESPIAENLLEVAQAYRVLEAGHELNLAKDSLNVLLNLERWGAQRFPSHVDHPRQWDVVSQSIELAAERLQQANVDRTLTEQLNQTRWSEAVREAGRKIGERRWRRDAMIGAGHELVDLRSRLAGVIETADPIMAEARAVIAKYAPTIPQMAEQAAEQIRQLEEETEQTADASEQSEPEKADAHQQPPKVGDLLQKQETINQQIEDLFEALVDDANSQDLLDEQQRERARDADDAIAMIEQPVSEANKALQAAAEKDVGELQAQELAQAAEHQEKTAQVLDLVAEHFAKLNEGHEVAETRESLRQAERDIGIARQMDERYEPSEQLAVVATRDATELMKELEAELTRNPAMQEALSEISQDTLQEARNALEYAAQDDQELQRANERSDREFQTKKRELAEDLRDLGTEASRLSRELVAQAINASAQGKTQPAQEKLTEAQRQLDTAADRANSAREEQLLADISRAANEVKAAMQAAADALNQAKEQTSKGKDEQIHPDDKAREAQKNNWQRSRQQFQDQQKRNAQNFAKQADDAKRRAEQAVQNQKRQVENLERQVQQAEQQLNQKPDDQGRKNNLANQQARLDAEKEKLAAAQRVHQREEADAKRARDQQDEVNRRQMPDLSAPNPATQVADQYTDFATALANELKQRSKSLADSANFGNELNPTQQQLASSKERQGQITEDVKQAAEDVARAARHERRLNNPVPVNALQQASQNIRDVANNESMTAENQLQAAAGEAEQAAQDQPDNPNAPNGEALKAQSAAETAENALARQAEHLTGILEPLIATNAAKNEETTPSNAGGQLVPNAAPSPVDGDQPSAIPGKGAQAGSSPEPFRKPTLTPEELERGQQLAKTLDELDRRAAEHSIQAAGANPAQAPRLDSLAQRAQAMRSAVTSQRLQSQQRAAQALNAAHESSDSPVLTAETGEFDVQIVNRIENSNWGKLRNQSAKDANSARGEPVSEEYRQSIEAYFRVLAERAKRK